MLKLWMTKLNPIRWKYEVYKWAAIVVLLIGYTYFWWDQGRDACVKKAAETEVAQMATAVTERMPVIARAERDAAQMEQDLKTLPALILQVIPSSVLAVRRLSLTSLGGSISIHTLRILFVIDEGLSQTQMANVLQVSDAAVSKSVANLLKKKLLRKKTGKDKRSYEVRLTPEGKRLLKEAQEQVEKALEECLKELSKEEQEQMQKGIVILSKLMQTIRTQLAAKTISQEL